MEKPKYQSKGQWLDIYLSTGIKLTSDGYAPDQKGKEEGKQNVSSLILLKILPKLKPSNKIFHKR